MVAKMTIKNQITIPKKVLERVGLANIKDEELYFDVEAQDNTILLKPVTVTVEERIPDKQWKKFEDWATKVEKGDVFFDSAAKAEGFLKKRAKKKQ